MEKSKSTSPNAFISVHPRSLGGHFFATSGRSYNIRVKVSPQCHLTVSYRLAAPSHFFRAPPFLFSSPARPWPTTLSLLRSSHICGSLILPPPRSFGIVSRAISPKTFAFSFIPPSTLPTPTRPLRPPLSARFSHSHAHRVFISRGPTVYRHRSPG